MVDKIENLEILVFLKAVIIISLAYVGIENEVFIVMNGAFFFDTFFGIIKSLRLERRITWNSLIWGVTIKYCILFIPFAVAVFAKVVAGANMMYVINMFVIVISANELISIIANILSIRLKEDIKNEDFVAMALRATQQFLGKYIKKIINSVKNEKEGN